MFVRMCVRVRLPSFVYIGFCARACVCEGAGQSVCICARLVARLLVPVFLHVPFTHYACAVDTVRVLFTHGACVFTLCACAVCALRMCCLRTVHVLCAHCAVAVYTLCMCCTCWPNDVHVLFAH